MPNNGPQAVFNQNLTTMPSIMFNDLRLLGSRRKSAILERHMNKRKIVGGAPP
jgi:hypothetical protein